MILFRSVVDVCTYVCLHIHVPLYIHTCSGSESTAPRRPTFFLPNFDMPLGWDCGNILSAADGESPFHSQLPRNHRVHPTSHVNRISRPLETFDTRSRVDQAIKRGGVLLVLERLERFFVRLDHPQDEEKTISLLRGPPSRYHIPPVPCLVSKASYERKKMMQCQSSIP